MEGVEERILSSVSSIVSEERTRGSGYGSSRENFDKISQVYRRAAAYVRTADDVLLQSFAFNVLPPLFELVLGSDILGRSQERTKGLMYNAPKLAVEFFAFSGPFFALLDAFGSPLGVMESIAAVNGVPLTEQPQETAPPNLSASLATACAKVASIEFADGSPSPDTEDSTAAALLPPRRSLYPAHLPAPRPFASASPPGSAGEGTRATVPAHPRWFAERVTAPIKISAAAAAAAVVKGGASRLLSAAAARQHIGGGAGGAGGEWGAAAAATSRRAAVGNVPLFNSIFFSYGQSVIPWWTCYVTVRDVEIGPFILTEGGTVELDAAAALEVIGTDISSTTKSAWLAPAATAAATAKARGTAANTATSAERAERVVAACRALCDAKDTAIADVTLLVSPLSFVTLALCRLVTKFAPRGYLTGPYAAGHGKAAAYLHDACSHISNAVVRYCVGPGGRIASQMTTALTKARVPGVAGAAHGVRGVLDYVLPALPAVESVVGDGGADGWGEERGPPHPRWLAGADVGAISAAVHAERARNADSTDAPLRGGAVEWLLSLVRQGGGSGRKDGQLVNDDAAEASRLEDEGGGARAAASLGTSSSASREAIARASVLREVGLRTKGHVDTVRANRATFPLRSLATLPTEDDESLSSVALLILVQLVAVAVDPTAAAVADAGTAPSQLWRTILREGQRFASTGSTLHLGRMVGAATTAATVAVGGRAEGSGDVCNSGGACWWFRRVPATAKSVQVQLAAEGDDEGRGPSPLSAGPSAAVSSISCPRAYIASSQTPAWWLRGGASPSAGNVDARTGAAAASGSGGGVRGDGVVVVGQRSYMVYTPDAVRGSEGVREFARKAAATAVSSGSVAQLPMFSDGSAGRMVLDAIAVAWLSFAHPLELRKREALPTSVYARYTSLLPAVHAMICACYNGSCVTAAIRAAHRSPTASMVHSAALAMMPVPSDFLPPLECSAQHAAVSVGVAALPSPLYLTFAHFAVCSLQSTEPKEAPVPFLPDDACSSGWLSQLLRTASVIAAGAMARSLHERAAYVAAHADIFITLPILAARAAVAIAARGPVGSREVAGAVAAALRPLLAAVEAAAPAVALVSHFVLTAATESLASKLATTVAPAASAAAGLSGQSFASKDFSPTLFARPGGVFNGPASTVALATAGFAPGATESEVWAVIGPHVRLVGAVGVTLEAAVQAYIGLCGVASACAPPSLRGVAVFTIAVRAALGLPLASTGVDSGSGELESRVGLATACSLFAPLRGALSASIRISLPPMRTVVDSGQVGEGGARAIAVATPYAPTLSGDRSRGGAQRSSSVPRIGGDGRYEDRATRAYAACLRQGDRARLHSDEVDALVRPLVQMQSSVRKIVPREVRRLVRLRPLASLHVLVPLVGFTTLWWRGWVGWILWLIGFAYSVAAYFILWHRDVLE